MRRETSFETIPRYNKKLQYLQRPDVIETPFGDLMADDEALDQFRGTMKDMYGIGVMLRDCSKKGKMSRKKFDSFMSHLNDMDDDKPLRDYI